MNNRCRVTEELNAHEIAETQRKTVSDDELKQIAEDAIEYFKAEPENVIEQLSANCESFEGDCSYAINIAGVLVTSTLDSKPTQAQVAVNDLINEWIRFSIEDEGYSADDGIRALQLIGDYSWEKS